MTPKEKANEIVKKYFFNTSISSIHTAIKCSLIAVDEIIAQLTPIEKAPKNKDAFLYWDEVKQEIEKL
jgi:hypothetical protein